MLILQLPVNFCPILFLFVYQDAVLKDHVKRNGACKWSVAACQLIGRTAMKCRQRWVNSLDPSIRLGPWSAAEVKCLIATYSVLWNVFSMYCIS